MARVGMLLVALLAMVAGIGVYHSQQYDFRTLDGTTWRWQQFQDQWVVVNYFAEWCAPCLREIPELNDFGQYAEQNPDLRLFGISYDALADDQLQQISERYNIEFPLITSDDPVMRNPRPKGLPATFIFNPQGQLVMQLNGEQTKASLQQTLKNVGRDM